MLHESISVARELFWQGGGGEGGWGGGRGGGGARGGVNCELSRHITRVNAKW